LSAGRRDRLLAGGLSVVVNVAALGALLWSQVDRPASRATPELPPLMVSVAEQPKPQPPGPPKEAEVQTVQPAAPPPVAKSAPVLDIEPVPDNSDLLSESQLAGATSAGEGGGGGGGGGCDMARLVQQALRRDRLVRAAVEDANRLGKAVMLWNGDWVRTGGQDGKGLSAVREAIMWEVAFAPETCRNEPMHGTVLLSLADGTTRFAVGSGEWRWADLLGVRKTAMNR
jgi:hypothetical protein